jgi:hypothetical protein
VFKKISETTKFSREKMKEKAMFFLFMSFRICIFNLSIFLDVFLCPVAKLKTFFDILPKKEEKVLLFFFFSSKLRVAQFYSSSFS